MNYFPLDIESIDYDNLDDWLSNYSIPDSPDKMYQLRKDIFDAYYGILNNHSSTFVGDLMLIRVKLPFEFYRIFSAYWIKGYAKGIGKEIKYSKSSLLFNWLENGKECQNTIPYSTLPTEKLPVYKKILRKLRYYIYNVRVNKDFFYYFKSKYNGLQTYDTNPNLLSMAYHRKNGRRFRYLPDYFFTVSKQAQDIDPDLKNKINNVVSEMITETRAISRNYKLDIDEETFDSLRKVICKHLITTAVDYHNVEQQFLKKIGLCNLSGGTQASYSNRMLALINKKNGGNVAGFMHGNEVGRVRDYRIESSIANTFVTYSKAAIKNVEDSVKQYGLVADNDVKVVSADTNIFEKYWNEQQKLSPPGKVEKIMIMCFAYDTNMNLDSVAPDLTSFHLEMKLVTLLIKAGYEVLYKIHPETLGVPGIKKITDSLKRHFGNKFTIIYEPLEEVAYKADAFLLYYSTTTTFNWLLCTQKPIILLDTDTYKRDHSEEAYRLLEKRCSMIPYTYDNKNLISFKDNDILDAFAEKPANPNFDFVHKYLLKE